MSTWSGTTRVVALSGTLVVLTASGAGLAWAATTTTNPATAGSQAHRLHTLVTAADKRLTAAEKRTAAADARVDHVPALKEADRNLLHSELGTLLTNIRAAQAKVDAATTPGKARAAVREAQPLLAQGRVIVRQVQQLRVADAAASTVAKAETRVAALSARVSKLPVDSPARAALTDLTSRLQDAAHQAAAVQAADRSLPVSNPKAANPVLAANAKALQALQADRRKIAADRRTILAALRAAHRTKKSA